MARTPKSLVRMLAAVLAVAACVWAPVSTWASAGTAAVGEGGLLFAELDAAFSFQKVDLANIESELVGIIVDGEDFGAELVYRQGEHYYLPTSLLTQMSVQGTARAGALYLSTPGGEVEAGTEYFREIFGAMFFRADLLDEVLRIRWEFLPESYAINMTLPWWQRSAGEGEFPRSGQDVDVQPTSFGLTQVRLDHSHFFNENQNYGYSNLLLRGRLADGVWRGELIHEERRDLRAENYYWLKDFERVQALVGNQDVLINPLLPVVQTTGAQALFSSNGIEFDPYQDQTRSQYIRRFGIPAKDIEGTAQPGAIAELRVNDRPLARVRVNLDGTYRFDQIRAKSLQFQTVKVHILDQRSFIELQVQDFTRTPIDLLLKKGQVVGFGGAGVNGNPLDPLRGADGEAAFGLMRFGVTDGLTVEGGIQSANGRMHQVAALSASLGRKFAFTASGGHHEGAYGYSTDLYGRGERWQMNLRSQEYGEGFRSLTSAESSFHELRYEHWLAPSFSVGLQGRHTENDAGGVSYLLPGVSWRFLGRNRLRVWPDFDGSYRFDLRTWHRQRDWFEFVHDSTGSRAEYRYFKSAQLEFFGRIFNQSELKRTTAELGTIWYANVYDDRSQLAASLLGGDDGFGFRFVWRTTVLPGLFSHLELRDEPVATEFNDPGLQVRWTMSVDLAIAGGRPVPARNDFIQSRVGSIGGRLLTADDSDIREEGMDQVAVLINGRPNTAVLRGKHFFVRNVPPGVYEVALGSEFLPMSMTPEKITYRVKVLPAATTTVDFVVNREFGLGGRVTSKDGNGAVGIRLEIWDEDGVLVKSTRTDQYGYYQLSGLLSGTYSVRVAGEHLEAEALSVTIENDFVFDANLIVAEHATVPSTDR